MFANKFGTHQNVECGLVCIIHPPENNYREEVKTIPVPLESVSIQASIVHAVAQIELTQVYVNKEEQPIEAIYYFPVDSNGGVTHFHAELEGKTIKGTVKPQEEAKAQYEKAVQEKKSAFLVESNKPDIFKVRIGYLKPGSQVKIVIGYVTEVKNEKGSNALRFFIPTTVSPRYVPSTDTDEKSVDLQNMTFSTNTPAPLTINVNVAIQGEIKSIESPSHKIDIVSKSLIPEKPSWTRAIVSLTGKTTDMDRDFILHIVPQEVHMPRLYQEKAEASTILMVHLIPSFNLDEQKVELIFVLDRSGSMQGQSIGLAKKALQLFLHSLPVDCYFNVVGFGSSFQFLFSESAKYDDGSLKKALLLAQDLDADMGGTEILQPLKEVLSRKQIDGYLRQVFVITDGEVSNTEQVIGFVKANAHVCRVFSIGIGDSASHDLVEGLAEAGGGTAAFATYNETIDSKVLQQLKNAIQPSLTNVNISWKGLSDLPTQIFAPVEINKEKTLLGYGKPINTKSTDDNIPIPTPKFSQVPANVPPIFDGSQLLVFGIFPAELPSEVCITAESPDGPLSVKIKVNAVSEYDLGSTRMLHKLAAIKRISELQLKVANAEALANEDAEANSLKAEIIDISCKNEITSKYTSFVAVDMESNQASDDNWVMQTRHVPSQYSHGWHGGAFGANISRHCTFGSMAAPTSRATRYSPGTDMMKKMKVTRSRGGGSGSGSINRMLCASTNMMQQAPAQLTNGGEAGYLGACSVPRMRKSAQSAVTGFCSSVTDAPADDEEEEFEEYKPTRPAKMEVVLTEADRLHKIVETQSFDGSFSLNKTFSDALQLNFDALKKDAKTNGWDEKAYATALALSYFSEKFGNLKDSWELVALKAKKWLQKHASTNFESLTSAALTYIKSI